MWLTYSPPLKRALGRLTEPARSIHNLDERRRVRLFSAVQLLIVLALIPPTMDILPIDSIYAYAPFTPELILQAIAYGLSRTRYYRWGVLVSLGALLGMAYYASFEAPFFGPDVMALHLMWLILPLLYGSFIFSPQFTIFMSVVVMVCFVGLPLFIPEMEYIDIAPVAFFVGIWSVAHNFLLRHNEIAEKNRREELRNTADKLAVVNRTLQAEIVERKSAEEKIEISLKEKEILLKEIHHRVKNNLQVISSLLNLQSAYITDQQSLEVLRESQNRVHSMALIHDKLYHSPDLSRVDFAEYVHNLTTSLFHSYNSQPDKISLKIEAEEILLGIDTAVPCGLILNELVSNALKHAFPNRAAGEIRVSCRGVEDLQLTLSVADNGVGFPNDVDYKNTTSLGLQLVNTLVNQLGGNFWLNNTFGTEFTVEFIGV